LTLGNTWGCASSWHPVYYRVWRVDFPESRLLIDRTESAYLRGDVFIVGSIGQDARESNPPIDVLVEFAEASADSRVHNREAIRHFLIEGDAVRRVDPVALSPHDFVDEWLTRPWEESAAWSASPALRRWHQDLHSNLIVGYFGTTMRCQAFGHWRVEVDPANPRRKEEADLRLYFLVRWDPPYHFKLESIADKPFANCNQPDRQADLWRTLFSNQEWRW
ncbi:MAG TPA: hypothetical protein VKT81_11855, partial [Bryobacteraceae bacterium]|nr:hypothetical protein [Bryobacteraceae bacterium]